MFSCIFHADVLHATVGSLCSPGLFREHTWTCQDLSSFRETSIVCSPCSSDPGRIAASDRYEACDVAPWATTEEAPTLTEISRFNSKAFKLTVYASQRRSFIATQNSFPAVGQTLPGRLVLQGTLQKALYMLTLHDFPPFTNFLTHGCSSAEPVSASPDKEQYTKQKHLGQSW
jgi:hypothetical protein